MFKKYTKVKIVISIMIGFCIISFCIWKITAKKVVVISHRGYPSKRQEHTFKGYDLAIESGSNFIEQDLVQSKEGTLFVSHDNSAKRLTGVDKEFNQMLDSEIEALETSSKESIHTLEDIFKRYGDQTNYVIETRESRDNQMEKELLILIKKFKLENNIIFQSFEFESLRFLKENSSIESYLLLVKKDNLDNLMIKIKQPQYNFITIVCPYRGDLTKKTINDIHKLKKQVFVYMLQEKDDEYKQALTQNIDGLFTDYSEEVIDFLKK